MFDPYPSNLLHHGKPNQDPKRTIIVLIFEAFQVKLDGIPRQDPDEVALEAAAAPGSRGLLALFRFFRDPKGTQA